MRLIHIKTEKECERQRQRERERERDSPVTARTGVNASQNMEELQSP